MKQISLFIALLIGINHSARSQNISISGSVSATTGISRSGSSGILLRCNYSFESLLK